MGRERESVLSPATRGRSDTDVESFILVISYPFSLLSLLLRLARLHVSTRSPSRALDSHHATRTSTAGPALIELLPAFLAGHLEFLRQLRLLSYR